MIVIISDDSRGNWGLRLEEALLPTGKQLVRFSANTLDIKPCTGCSSCSGKTYGRCVMQDDMHLVVQKIAGCQALVMLSPVVFGGVSHHIKKVMDRIAVLGDPRYRMKDGELVKGMRVPGLRYYMIGVGDKMSETEQKAFLSLHAENRKIMDVQGQAFFLDSRMDKSALEQVAKEISHE